MEGADWSATAGFGTLSIMTPETHPGPYGSLRVEGVSFHPVIRLEAGYEVYDFTDGYDPERALASPYGVGRYNERRPGMYAGEQFAEGRRDVHVGVDLAAPQGAPVHAFYRGTIFRLGDNALPYDYGPTLITRHEWLNQTVFALHGHLSRESLGRWSPGDAFEAGEVLGWLGGREVNGGWNPHVHFQLCLAEPETHDLPGALSEGDLDWGLAVFPDPRLVLGPLY